MSDRAIEAAESPDARVRLAFGGYVGLLAAGAVATLAAVADTPALALLGAAIAGFLVGCLGGVAVASRSRGLAVRLGRSWGWRAALVLLPVPFGLAAGIALLTPLESRVLLVALASAIAVAIAGMVLRWLVATRYTDAITTGAPIGTWQWTPPGTPKLDALLFVLWLLLAVSNALSGNWAGALVWIGLTALWLCSGLAEGRWRVGSFGATPEIRVYEDGLVKRRPYTRSFVSWDEVSHVRLREDELVLDRGLFDVRFDRDELPELEAVRAEIDRR